MTESTDPVKVDATRRLWRLREKLRQLVIDARWDPDLKDEVADIESCIRSCEKELAREPV